MDPQNRNTKQLPVQLLVFYWSLQASSALSSLGLQEKQNRGYVTESLASQTLPHFTA